MKVSRKLLPAILTALCMAAFASQAAAQGGTWAVKAPLPVPSGLGGFTMGSINGKVYVVGGQLGSGVVATLVVYDPVTNTWATKTPMSTARAGAEAAVVNGLLYVIGGCTSAGCGSRVGTVEAYDPVTDTWTTKAPMPTSRWDFGIGVINGVIYAVGGRQGGNNEAYDPATNSWTTKAPMSTARETRAEVVNGLLYVMGGYDGCCTTFDIVTAYDPSTDTWVNKASLPSPRSAGGTGVMNGKIYFAGGSSGADGELVVYNPAANTWSIDVPLPTTCPPACAGTTANGVLYISGETSRSNFLAFTPAASPQQLLTSLADMIANLNILSGIANSLDAKLLAAQSSLAGAKNNDINTSCNQIGAFINAVSAQSGNQLTAGQASQLIGQANLIRSVLVCP